MLWGAFLRDFLETKILASGDRGDADQRRDSIGVWLGIGNFEQQVWATTLGGDFGNVYKQNRSESLNRLNLRRGRQHSSVQ
ncbi:MAG: hypothetical protein AAGF66_12200 [Cyanobacteria bacterium P01_H01_bin.119]